MIRKVHNVRQNNHFFSLWVCFFRNVRSKPNIYWKNKGQNSFYLCPDMATKISKTQTSLVVQWLRICLPMQGTRVRALVQEDPTCRGATKPVRHNYWACTLEPASHNYWALVPQLLKPARLEPMLRNRRSHLNEKPVPHNEEEPPITATRESLHVQQRRPNAAKIKLIN